MCVDTGGVGGDGLSCAVGKVCHAGACVACASGAPCTPQNPCGVGATDCSTGAPVCKDTGDTLPDGTACGNGGMCLAGTCSTCTQTPCNPSNVDMAMNVGPNDGGVPPAADLTMSSPLELATGLYFPNRIAAGATRVFFTDKSNSVFTIPRDQKDATPTLLVSNVPAANPLVAVGRQLFYQTASGISVINDDGTGQAMIVSVTAINPGNGAMPLPWTIANNKLFYVVPPAGCGCRTNFGGMFSCSPSYQAACSFGMCACGTNAQLMMTNLDGTGAMGVGAPLNADVMALAADANWLYVAACVNMGGYVALSQLDAYSLTGGATRTIGTFTQAACLPYAFNESIAVDSKYVYYDAFSGNVGQTSYTLYGWMNDVWTRELSSGGSPSTLQNNAFMKLLTDGTSDFAIVPSGIVYQFPEAGSVANATTIYSSANDFDMDASYVYVTDTSNGTIDRLPKH